MSCQSIHSFLRCHLNESRMVQYDDFVGRERCGIGRERSVMITLLVANSMEQVVSGMRATSIRVHESC